MNSIIPLIQVEPALGDGWRRWAPDGAQALARCATFVAEHRRGDRRQAPDPLDAPHEATRARDQIKAPNEGVAG